MRLLSICSSLIVIIFFLSGCSSTGLTSSSHVTNVQLSNPNFRIVATNVSGEATVHGLLGTSYGFGAFTSQMALIPLSKNRMLYKTAMQNLWSNFESTNGAVANRRLALTNLRYDTQSVNLFLYTKVTSVVVADIVEFQ